MKKISELDFYAQTTGKYWPFKDLAINEGVEIKDGYNGKDIETIRKCAFSYASSAGIKLKSQIVNGGIKSIQFLRIK